jgi:uncharacterized membrane protein
MWFLRSTVFLLLVLATAACDPGDCPEGSTVSWTDVEPLFAEHCISCHSSELSGDDRVEAPENYNYDTMEAAQAHPNWTWAEIKLGHMPPTDPLSEEEQELVREWLACQ